MCNNNLGKLFLVLTFILCLCVFIVTMHPKAYLPFFRKVRGLLFIFLGLAAGTPQFYAIFFPNNLITLYPLFWVLGGISYIIGGLIYVLRIPEKYFPIKFDNFGNSHNILHAGVLLGSLFHFLGSLECYYFRKITPCFI